MSIAPKPILLRDLKQDMRPFREGRGWAPGYYTNICIKCKGGFIGEKRAYECAPCAYADEGMEEDRDS